MQAYYDKDADLSIIRGKKVAIIGYGSQGHAHALNLRDSGVGDVAIGLRPNSPSADKALKAQFRVMTPSDAASWADVVMILTPDELQAALYRNHLAAAMKKNAALAFAHGFNIHFNLIEPRADLDVFMVSPNGAGPAVRAEYARGGGVPCLLAVHRDVTGAARALGLSYAAAIGCGRAGIMETSFREECETDLFGEQAILCGGLPELIKAGYDTLTGAGYAPEIAYIVCLHEVKLVVDLLYAGGLSGMRTAISNTAEYGGYKTGPRLVTEETRREMKRVLEDIQSGRFARDWMRECADGQPGFKALRQSEAAHPIEKIGAALRAMMPWITQKK